MYKQHINRTAIFAILGIIVAFIIAKVSKPIYESQLELLVSQTNVDRNPNSPLSPDVQRIVEQGTNANLQTERQLLTSLAVFYRACSRVADVNDAPELRDNFIDYYRMYDATSARSSNQNQDQAGVIALQARAYDPKVASDLANEIAFQYNEVRKQNAKEAVADGIRYLQEQMTLSAVDLKNAEEAYKAFKQENNVSDISLKVRDEQAKLTALEQALLQQVAFKDAAEAEIAGYRGRLAALPKSQDGGKSNVRHPQIAVFEARIADLKGNRQQLLATYLEDSVQIRAIDDTIKTLEEQIRKLDKSGMTTAGGSVVPDNAYQAVRTQLEGALARKLSAEGSIAAVTQQIADQKVLLATLPSKEVAISQLQRDLAIYDEKYRRQKSQMEELKNRSEIGSRAATILNTATPNETPVAPEVSKFVFIGGIAGACLGMLFSFLVESLRLRVASSSQLTDLTGLPVAAAVPMLRGPQRLIRTFSRADASPVEAFRFMAFSNIGKPDGAKSYAFTGIRTAVGSYNSATQFAVAMSRAGARVLLVDCDIIRGPISKSFDAAGKKGLSDLLSGDPSGSAASEFFVPTAHENLVLMPSGTGVVKFLSDIPASRIQAATDLLAKSADVVIYALPPCDVLADASLIVPHVQETCLVISAKATNYRTIPSAYDVLQRAGAQKVSMILTDASAAEEAFGRKAAYLAKLD